MRFVARVWKVGRASMVVTIPSNVAKKLALQHGDLVLVEVRKIHVPNK